MIALGLTAVAGFVVLALLWRHAGKRQHPHAARVRDPKRPTDNYQCVEVRFGTDACDAVRKFEARRLLSGEAPEIPVPGCDAAECSCRYVHHKDRRHGERRNHAAYHPPTTTGRDRRTKRDRRRPGKSPFGPKARQ